MISVIIPCFNSDTEMLQKCISSVKQQTYKDIEIILVDDGSRNNILNDLRNLVENLGGIKLVESLHVGVSEARNIGVKESRGDYITFIDSDDYIAPWMLEDLLMSIQDNNVKIALGYINPVEQTDNYSFTREESSTAILSEIELWKLALVGFSTKISSRGYISCGPCAALYEKSLVKTIEFPKELDVFEDVVWNVEIFNLAKQAVVVPETIYAYRQRINSITHIWELKIIQKRIRSLDYIEQVLKNDSEARQWFAIRVLANYSSVITCIMKTDELNGIFERFNYAWKISQNRVWNILMEKKISKNWETKYKFKLFLYKIRALILIYYVKYGCR